MSNFRVVDSIFSYYEKYNVLLSGIGSIQTQKDHGENTNISFSAKFDYKTACAGFGFRGYNDALLFGGGRGHYKNSPDVGWGISVDVVSEGYPGNILLGFNYGKIVQSTCIPIRYPTNFKPDEFKDYLIKDYGSTIQLFVNDKLFAIIVFGATIDDGMFYDGGQVYDEHNVFINSFTEKIAVTGTFSFFARISTVTISNIIITNSDDKVITKDIYKDSLTNDKDWYCIYSKIILLDPLNCSVIDARNFLRLYYIERGNIMYTDEKGSKVLEENNIYLLPRKTYKLQSNNNMKVKYHWCYVNSNKPQYYNDVVKINNSFLYSLYINIIKKILDSYAETTAEADIMQISNQNPYYSVICNTINALLEFHWVENYYKEIRKFDYLTEYIQNNLNKDLSNDTLARISMYNKAYFINAFESVFKETPQKYVERLRLAEAVSLLLKNEKVETIALNIGYSSAKSFSRAFKRQTGFSPSEYRTKHIIEY